MKKLSEKKYWDNIYKNFQKENKTNENLSIFFLLKNWLKYLTRDYSNYVLLELYKKYLPRSDQMKVIEIGCAPGKYLINFKNEFGYKPYGVEYSDKGAQITKENFKKNGLNPENIIKADFFDENFQNEYKENFDLVFSRGFIEHFDNTTEVIEKHINLLKKGGYIVISIPNLSGLNYFLLNYLNRDSLITHNFSLMNKNNFREVFKKNKLHFLYCDFVGIFSFGLLNTNKRWKYYLWRMLLILQRPFDFLWRIVFGTYHIKSGYTSPYLFFIGRKI